MPRLERNNRKARNKPGPGRFIFLTIGLFATVVLLAACGAVAWVLSVSASAPDLSELKPAKKGAVSIVYAADGSILARLSSDVLRTPLKQAQIPTLMTEATVAVEDKRFYKHDGVDYEGVIRAAIKNVTTGKTLQAESAFCSAAADEPSANQRNGKGDQRLKDAITARGAMT